MKNIFLVISSFLAAVFMPLLILASGIWAIACYNIGKPQDGLIPILIMCAVLIAYIKIKFPR
jgi:hypothetical protein